MALEQGCLQQTSSRPESLRHALSPSNPQPLVCAASPNQNQVNGSRLLCLSPDMLKRIELNHVSKNVCFRARPWRRPIRPSSESIETCISALREATKGLATALGIRPYDPEKDRSGLEVEDKFADLSSDPSFYNELFKELEGQLKEGFIKDSINIQEWCQGNKPQNYAFQKFIERSDRTELAKIVAMMEPVIPSLVVDRQGHYVVKKLMLKSPSFLKKVEAHCSTNFIGLSQDEYASRVMQLLVGKSPSFLELVINFARKSPKHTYTSVTTMFVLVAALRVCEGQRNLLFVRENFEKNPTVFGSKLFKRVLISYVQFSSSEEILLLWKTILRLYPLNTMLKDRFGSLLFLMFVRRALPSILNDLGLWIKTNLTALFGARYFRSIAANLTYSKYAAARGTLLFALLEASPSRLTQLKKEKSQYGLYLYTVLQLFDALLQPGPTPELCYFSRGELLQRANEFLAIHHPLDLLGDFPEKIDPPVSASIQEPASRLARANK